MADEQADQLARIRMTREEYLATGDQAALNASLRLGKSALASFSGARALEGAAALELAASLGVLYDMDGRIADLDEALGLLDRAERVLPADHADMAAVHTNVSGMRVKRFIKCGDRHDLESAVAAGWRAVEATAAGDPKLAVRYANLTGELRTLYQATGDLQALDQSIECGRAASKALQPSTQAESMVLATLAGSLQARCSRTLSTADLEESISIARRALAQTPGASPRRPAAVSILASGLRLRFELTGNVSSLTEAITLHREMADQVRDSQPEHGIHMLQVAATLLVRFERLHVKSDLDAAEFAAERALGSANSLTEGQANYVRAVCLRERAAILAGSGDQAAAGKAAKQAVAAAKRALALALTGSDRSLHADCVLQVCNALANRYKITQAAEHRAEAIAAYRDALERLGQNEQLNQLCNLNLGHVYQRSMESGAASTNDLLQAVDLYQEVLSSAEPRDRFWAPATLGSLQSLARLSEIDTDLVSADAALGLYRQLAAAPAPPPLALAHAGLLTSRLLMSAGASVDAAEVLAETVRLLPAVAWRGIDRESRESQLAQFSAIGCDAAASLLAAGQAQAAVEAVELGRSVLWADMLQLRHGDAGVWRDHPLQAERLRDLAAALDVPDVILDEDHGVSRVVDRRMALAAEWDELVAQIRRAGHEDFLRPVRFTDLLAAAANGPVVTVNVSRYRCDALILTGEGVRPLKLPLLRAEDVAGQAARYVEAYARVDRAEKMNGDVEGPRRDLEMTLFDVLEWLWDTVADPVLAALGFDDCPQQGRPWRRMWWCPTGLLNLLPLHAAGRHRSAATTRPQTVLDRAVSSYTPTLAALADANRSASAAAGAGKLLVVALPITASEKALPLAREECDLLAAKLDGHCRVLYEDAATKVAVRAELERHRWVHFSCHGRQNLAAPSEAGLLLHGRDELRIADLSAAHHEAEFAFLSACQSATGGSTLPDEAISLAAAFQYSGYRHVIATLWEVYVLAAHAVTERVYTVLTESGQFAPARSSYALHSALREQRDSHQTTPSWWTPFVHIGP